MNGKCDYPNCNENAIHRILGDKYGNDGCKDHTSTIRTLYKTKIEPNVLITIKVY